MICLIPVNGDSRNIVVFWGGGNHQYELNITMFVKQNRFFSNFQTFGEPFFR